MRIVVSDSSCLIDLRKASLLDAFLKLPYELLIPNTLFEDELLNREEFGTLKECKVLVEDYRKEYNHRRPHSGLGYLTPAKFAASCAGTGFAALSPCQHTSIAIKEESTILS